MLYSEFYDRTKHLASTEEYHYIEESYYEFDGDKDQFCKQWLKDKNSGVWAKELRLRKLVDETRQEMQKTIDEMADNLKWYSEQYDELWKFKNMVRGIRDSINSETVPMVPASISRTLQSMASGKSSMGTTPAATKMPAPIAATQGRYFGSMIISTKVRTNRLSA